MRARRGTGTTEPGDATRRLALATLAFTIAEASILALSGYTGAVVADLELSSAQTGALTATLTVTFGLVQVPTGLLARRVGTRATLVVGLLLFAAGALGSATTPSYGRMVITQAVTGAGAGMIVPSASAVAMHPDPLINTRRQGVVGSGWGIGYLLGLLVIPWLVPSWRAALGALAVAAALTGLTALALLRTSPRVLAGGAAGTELRLGRGVWSLALIMAGIAMANVGASAWAPAILGEAGASRGEALLAASMIGWGILLGALGGPVTVARGYGVPGVATVAAILMTTSLLVLAAEPGALGSLAALFTIGVATGIVFPVLLGSVPVVAGTTHPSGQALVAGIVNGTGMLGASAGPPVVGLVADATGAVAPGVAALCVGPAVSCLFALGVLRGAQHPRARETSATQGG